ncbi:hypothetical protein ON010_g12784 [Phytophthora cinnamomi]|nr:hypothetical protein ON010_g12784 [Phytophthora cinnamomi]
MALSRQVEALVVVGDSRIAIQQAQGFIHCHQPNLQKHLAKCEVQMGKFRSQRLVHIKREHNQAADYLTTKTLALGESWSVQDSEELVHLERVSRIAEKLMKPKVDQRPDTSTQTKKEGEVAADAQFAPLSHAAKVIAVLTRSRARDGERLNPEVDGGTSSHDGESRRSMAPVEYQSERCRRIRTHQDQDPYLSEIKSFLIGAAERFSPRRLRKIVKVVDLFALDARGRPLSSGSVDPGPSS